MKNIISLILLGTFHCSIIFGNTNDPPIDGGKLRLNIEFGNGRNCQGWGICEIDILVYSEGFQTGALGGLQVNPEHSNFELTFTRQDLLKYQPDKLAILDGKQTVTFDEAYIFPSSIQEAAESEKVLVINAGTYPLTYVNGIYSIVFPY